MYIPARFTVSIKHDFQLTYYFLLKIFQNGRTFHISIQIKKVGLKKQLLNYIEIHHYHMRNALIHI